MIEENFDKIYKAFRINLYRHIFSILGQRHSSLSASDYFSVEIIYLLGNPTITEFAHALSISQPNATYRIKSLIDKGYVTKEATDKKNMFRLSVTEKFMTYFHKDLGYGRFIFQMLSEKFSEEKLAEIDGIFEAFIQQIQIEEKQSCCKS